MEYRHWKVEMKEVGRERPITTTVSGEYDEKDVVDFLGLDNDDIEWYKLKEIEK